jgi:hypothetical protein
MGKEIKILLVTKFGFLQRSILVLFLVCIGVYLQDKLIVNATTLDANRAYFLWAGVKPQPMLKTAETVYILSGEVRQNDNTKIISLKASPPSISYAKVWMTLRVERIDWKDQVFDQILSDLRRWEIAGNALKGLQIDFDSATLHLDKYTIFLTKLRKILPRHLSLSVTGVMDWLVLGDPDVLEDLGQIADEVVIQTYQDRETIEDYQIYLRSLHKLKFPYYLAIVQNGKWQEPRDLRHDPNFQGYVIFLLNPSSSQFLK